MSDSVTPVLNHAQGDWFNASMYDYVHPEDQDKVREQLDTSDSSQSSNGRILGEAQYFIINVSYC